MTTMTGPPRPEPSLRETLSTADEIELQLTEHWQEYSEFQTRLDELRSAQEALRRMAGSVNAATEAGQGIPATLASLIGHGQAPDAWGAEMLALASDAVGEILLNTAMHSGATSTQAGMKRHAGWLLISLADNGVGGAAFTPDGELSRLRDRIRAAGGMISIDSEPDSDASSDPGSGTGTSVTVALPLAVPGPDGVPA